jgi:SAM-dependent methyltransferase
VPDALFADRRLAEIYDPFDPDRSDLDAYAAMVEEFGAGHVLDVGCGPGTFACLLASRGIEVTASIRRRRRWTSPGANRTRSGCAGSSATRRGCLLCRRISRR